MVSTSDEALPAFDSFVMPQLAIEHHHMESIFVVWLGKADCWWCMVLGGSSGVLHMLSFSWVEPQPSKACKQVSHKTDALKVIGCAGIRLRQYCSG